MEPSKQPVKRALDFQRFIYSTIVEFSHELDDIFLREISKSAKETHELCEEILKRRR